jgi:hypothetical protein
MLLSQEESQEKPNTIILSRFIKDDRLNIETEITFQIDIGLRNYRNDPIRFAKYKFESNDNTKSIFSWLSFGEFQDSQYIGFFELDSIKSWLEGKQLTDMISHFLRESDHFFIFDLNHVFSNTHGINIKKVSLNKSPNIPKLEDSITRENNVLKYFSPPPYPELNEDESVKAWHRNPGEIDIVAYNMSVYGILSNTPKNLIPSPDNILINNYSDINVQLINHVLDRLRLREGFTDVYKNLLNSTELTNKFTRELQDLYFQQLNYLLNTETHPNYTQIKDIIIHKLTSLTMINDEGNITLDENNRYDVKISVYNHIFKLLEKYRIVNPTFIIQKKVIEYINKHFIGALLNIASFLNNRERNIVTIGILTEVRQIANEVYHIATEPVQNANIVHMQYQKIDAAQDRYIKEKRKYMKLKSLYGII